MLTRLTFAFAFAAFGVLIALVTPDVVAAVLLFVAVFALFFLRDREREARLVAKRLSDELERKLAVVESQLARANQKLIGQNTMLLATVDSLEAALVVCDQNGVALFVNPAAALVLRGATPILGENVQKALREGDLEELAALYEDLSAGMGAQKRELRRHTELLSAQITPLTGENDEFLGAILIVADVTAQRELDRMKTDFVGYVAHELRTPLTTIFGYANLLGQNAARLDTEQLLQIGEVLGRHCRRMNRLIADLLDLSRIEAGMDVTILPKKFDLAAMCHRLAAEKSAFLNPTPPLQIEVAVPEIEIYADPDRTEQILVNLLSNAVKYSPDGGKVTVSARETETEIVVEIADEGMGLTGAQLQKLFGKFYRAKDAQNRGIKGNGLGLNLVKRLVEAHGGRIEAHSERDAGKKGATFRVFFPKNRAASQVNC